MQIPSLFSRANPGAPRWAVPVLDAIETRGLSESVVMIVCRHPTTGKVVQWGSGFIVAALPDSMWMLTAAHLFTDWIETAERRKDAVPDSSLSVADRLKQYIADDSFGVVVNFDHPVGRASCQITSVTLGGQPVSDAALMRVRYPSGAEWRHVAVLPLDLEPFPVWAPVVIAGYSGAQVAAGRAEDHWQGFGQAAIRNLYCRVGHVAERARTSSTMLGVSIPSLPGMTGGPVILDRNFIDGVVHVLPHKSRFPLSVVGIISRDHSDAALPEGSRDGETWASPIADALDLPVGPERSLKDAIEEGLVSTLTPEAIARYS